MLTVNEAIDAILARCRPLPARPTSLIDALGLTLAEEIAADIDLPPFDKALMDGYAIRSADLATGGERCFRVTEEITAGRVPIYPIHEGQAARIMTGTPCPPAPMPSSWSNDQGWMARTSSSLAPWPLA